MKFIGLFIILLLGGLGILHADDYRDNSNWLSNISDDTKISDLSIPFSHDSFMWESNINLRGKCSLSFVECQESNIQDQFFVGNRGFDIRTYVENNNRNDKTHQIGIAHGHDTFWGESNIQLEEAFKQFDQLLNDHPKEFLFFRISIERDIGEDNGNCDAYVTQANNLINKYPNRFITYRDGLTVGECRGKFLVGYKDGKGSFDKEGTVDPFSKLGNMNQWFKTIYGNDGGVDELMGRFDAINRNNKPAFIECNRPWTFCVNSPKGFAKTINLRVEDKLLHINFAGMVSHDFSNHWWYVPNRVINLNNRFK